MDLKPFDYSPDKRNEKRTMIVARGMVWDGEPVEPEAEIKVPNFLVPWLRVKLKAGLDASEAKAMSEEIAKERGGQRRRANPRTPAPKAKASSGD